MDSTLISSSSKLPIKRKSPEPGSDPNTPPFKFHRIWTEPDEIRFLQGLLDCGNFENMCYPRDLNVFYTKFSNNMSQPYTRSQLSEKLRRLKKKFRVICARLVNKGLDFKLLSPHDRALYELSKQLWHPDFAETSPFNAEKSKKKSSLVGVKVCFLPAFSGPGTGRGPTCGGLAGEGKAHDGFSVSEENVGVEGSLLPALPCFSGPGRPNCDVSAGRDLTHDGASVSEENVGVKVSSSHMLPNFPGTSQGPDSDGVTGGVSPMLPSFLGTSQGPDRDGVTGGVSVSEENIGVKVSSLHTLPYLSGPVRDPDKGPNSDGVTGKDLTRDRVSVSEENAEVGDNENEENDGKNDGDGGGGDEDDGKLSEVKVELDRGEMGEKRVVGSFSDGPVQVGVGSGTGEIAAKAVMDVFDECLKDFRNGEKSNLGGVLREVSLDKFEERWREQRVAELDVMARRLSYMVPAYDHLYLHRKIEAVNP